MKNVTPALLILIAILFTGWPVKAQIDQQTSSLRNVIPPSPNASSLGKYADWPVNLYTGVPQIDIPIYELKGRSLSVPISLSYHASGIKVGENASCVGLGWSLQAGGVITRSVRGLADEDQGPGYLSVRSYYNNPGDLSSGSIATGNSAFTDSSLQLSIANGNVEAQPDLFMLSAFGRSYKFYFSGNGTIITQPYSNVKISFNSTAGSWTVITEDGTKLLFGGSTSFEEVTNTFQTTTINDPYVSSWYLKSITSPAGEVISFTYYLSGSVTLDSYFSESDFLLNYIATNNLVTGVPGTIKTAKTIGQTMSMGFITLASIETDLGKVYFDTLSRSDLPGSVAVSGIRIFSKLQNKTIKSFLLNYVYSTATGGNVYTLGYSTPLSRLKLNSLEEVPTDISPHKFWQFAYNPLSLPSRKSYAQDYWGYYNGATANTTMKPFVINFSPDNYSYANRFPDSASMMAEMLSRITYPTGGYSQFTFEPNSYPANEEQFTSVPVSQSLYLTYNQSNFADSIVNTFTITKLQYIKYLFSGVFSTTYLNDYGTGVKLAGAVIRDYSGNVVSQEGLFKPASGNNASISSASILLSPGTYTFTMYSVSTQADFGSTAQNVSLSSSFAYMGSLGVKSINHAVGGVRVRRIVYNDNVDTTKSIIKTYSYSGANVVAPIDTTVDFVVPTIDNLYDCNPPPNNITACGLPGCLATSVIYYERNSSTKFGLGSIQGGTVGYSKVTETLGATGQGGSNVYYYIYSADANIPSSKVLPYPPIISYDYQRGLLAENDSYTAAGVLVSKSANTYQFINRGTITAYKVAYKFNILSSCFTYSYLANLLNRVFFQDKTNQVQKTSSTQTSYNTATGDSLVAVTYYYYDDTLNMQPIRMVTFNSKGDSVVTYSRTALEKAAINSSIALSTAASLAIDSMNVRNMVGIPLESEKYTKSVLSNKALTNYKLQSGGLLFPDNVMVQNASNAIETRVYFPRYSSKGNLLEQLKASSEKHDYIWDYQSTYPVAEVINADSSSIAFTSFEADGTGNWTVSSSIRDSVTPAITGYKSYNLSNGSISTATLLSAKTYVVSYWSKNGAYTVTSGGTPKTGKTVSVNGTSWTYYEYSITGVTGITISGSGNIDELRLYPAGAQMNTYTYLPLIGISSQCDLNNRITYYQYDSYLQLLLVLDQDRNVLKKFCYNYFGQSIACLQFSNSVKTGTFTRNNCGAGYTGSAVVYTVPVNTYYSLVSQAAADSMAQLDVNANGQNYANTNGTCTATGFAITATNYTGLSGFSVTYTNTSTSVQTVFTIPSGGGNIGTLPAATYNVTIAKSGNTTTKYIYGVCGVIHASSVTGSFTSVTISSSCNTLSIDTVQ